MTSALLIVTLCTSLALTLGIPQSLSTEAGDFVQQFIQHMPSDKYKRIVKKTINSLPANAMACIKRVENKNKDIVIAIERIIGEKFKEFIQVNLHLIKDGFESVRRILHGMKDTFDVAELFSGAGGMDRKHKKTAKKRPICDKNEMDGIKAALKKSFSAIQRKFFSS